MRITIEIDGKHIVAIEVTSPPDGATPDSLARAEVPRELLEAARARGAQSAGPAAFIQAGGAARVPPGELAAAAPAAVLSATTGVGGDLDAGPATMADVTEVTAPRPASRRQAKVRKARQRR
jgi:hypothetical protein